MATPTANPSRKQSVRDISFAIAAVLSLLATFMTLAGYGVALAMDQFGVAHETLYGSTLDLLDLSCWVVLFFFENVGRISFWKEYVRLLPSIAPGVALGYVLLLAYIGYARYGVALVRRGQLAHRWVAWIRPTKSDAMLRAAVKMGVYCTAVWIVFPAFCVAAMASIIVAASSLLAAPYMGFAAGNLHVSTHVIEPERCEPVRSRASRMANDRLHAPKASSTANCVAVRTERGFYAKGRVVMATTSAILLFDPATGKAIRIPTKDAIVESVADLGTVEASEAVTAARPPEPGAPRVHGSQAHPPPVSPTWP